MQIGIRAVSAQFDEADTFEAETDDELLFRVAVTVVPDTAVRAQHVRVLTREAIETRTTQAVFAFDDEAQAEREFAERLLISLDGGEPCDQIAFTVRRAARVEFVVEHARRERPDRPLGQLPDRLHIVMAIDDEAMRPCAELAIDNRETAAQTKRPRARADALHHLFDLLRHRAHPRPARRHRRHATQSLQPLDESGSMTINVTIKLGNSH